MNFKRYIWILGRKIELELRANDNLKGVSIGEKLSYSFYDGIYQGMPLLFLEPKNGNPTPRECDITGRRLSEALGLPVVFILAPGPTYERQRLMDKGVYFIMSERYAHLPMIVAMEKTSNRKKAEVLTPVGQYLLLYHLQVCSLEGMSARMIAPLLPYSYESVTLGITCLEDVSLCRKVQNGQRSKVIHFELKGEDLWDKAQNVLQSPVEYRMYCDAIRLSADYPVCGINALAHYTMLNPDKERMIMMTGKEYRAIKSADAIDNPNPYDGNIMVEVWKHPVVSIKGNNDGWVDRLSLILSLREDDDPRVEKEVERIINELKWTD
ncbi:MAG: hypothetical protein J6C78_02860 [Muribaculaceae bacterium]|nr:hypothetical protein [Muribaculaceae bacterium]